MRKREILDLAAAWFALSLAFGNLLGGLTPISVGIAAGTAGLGFFLHELAHRVVARRYGLSAVFQADYGMLFFAVLGSFAGFVFAAPGAVVTRGRRTLEQQKWISAAGPATNILLASGFSVVPGLVGNYGFRINAFLALFNMIPFGNIDGRKILEGGKLLYGSMVVASALLLALSYVN